MGSGPVFAGGMELPGHGARGLGRAGSMVAGVDDGSAIFYNPAGLAGIDGISALAEGGLVFQQVQYDRINSLGGPENGVQGSMDLLPLPTLALTWKPQKLQRFTFAAGVWVPYLGLNSYDPDGPQRYTSITLKGSLLAVFELAMAFKINEHFWIGAGFENMAMRFKSRVTLSACTQLNCTPEQKSFDSLTEVDALALFVPSGIFGLSVVYPKFRIGVSAQLPFWVRADGNVRSRLPSDPMFDGARIEGDQVGVGFELPLIVRAGVEYRPIEKLRLELGFDYEGWSIQNEFTIQPRDISIVDIPGLNSYKLSTMHLVRGLVDSFSLHLGGEYDVLRRLTLRAGYLYETSATPDAAMSTLFPDGEHHMLTFGVGVRLWKLRFDIGYGHIFTPDRNVSNSAVLQLNPINPSIAVPVGNGHYQIGTDILALGVEGRF